MRQPEEDADSSVDAGDVIIAIDAVDVDGQRAARRRLYGVLKYAGSCAGNQVDDALIIPVVRERHVREIFRSKFCVQIRLIRLQRDLARVHGDAFGNLTYLQRDVLATHRVHRDSDAMLRQRAEPAGAIVRS